MANLLKKHVSLNDAEHLERISVHLDLLKTNSFYFMGLVGYDSAHLGNLLQEQVVQLLEEKNMDYSVLVEKEKNIIFDHSQMSKDTFVVIRYDEEDTNFLISLNVTRDRFINNAYRFLILCPQKTWFDFSEIAPDFTSRLSVYCFLQDLLKGYSKTIYHNEEKIDIKLKNIMSELEYLKNRKFTENVVKSLVNLLENLVDLGKYDDYSYEIACWAEKGAKKIQNNYLLAKCYFNQYSILFHQGELKKALKLVKKEEKLLVQIENTNLAQCYGNQSLILIDLGQFHLASKLLKKQFELGKIHHSNDDIIFAQYNVNKINLYLGNFNIVNDFFNNKETVFSNTLGNLTILIIWASFQIKLGNLKEPFGWLCTNDFLFFDDGDVYQKINLFHFQAEILRIWGNTDDSLVLFDEALKIANQTRGLQGIAVILNAKSRLFRGISQLNKSFELLIEAEKIFIKMGDKVHLIDNYTYQIQVLLLQNQIKKALEVAEKQAELCEFMQSRRFFAHYYLNKGQISLAQNQLNEAWQLFDKANIVFAEIEEKEPLIRLNQHQAIIKTQQKEYQQALNHINNAAEWAFDMSYKEGYATALMQKGIILVEGFKRNKEAIYLLKKALSIANELNNSLLINQLEELLEKYQNS